jgi:hypothetical protein
MFLFYLKDVSFGYLDFVYAYKIKVLISEVKGKSKIPFLASATFSPSPPHAYQLLNPNIPYQNST